jgi:hypothetical protein
VRCALCCEVVQPEFSVSVLQLGFSQLLLVLDDGSACISAVCAGSAVADLLQLRLVTKLLTARYNVCLYLHDMLQCRHSSCILRHCGRRTAVAC